MGQVDRPAATMISETRVPTAHASRYIQRLCKHWSHNSAVEYDALHGKIVIPWNARGASWPADAIVRMDAMPGMLVCRVEAAAAEQLAVLKHAVQEHLNRFAFREGSLRFDWVEKPATLADVDA